MKAFLIFLIIPGSFAVYFALMAAFGIFQRWPVAHFAVALAALVWLFQLWRERRTLARLGFNIAGWIITAVMAWWMFSYSNFGPAPQLGASAPAASVLDLPLRDQGGQPTDLRAQLGRGKALLLVFYRGRW